MGSKLIPRFSSSVPCKFLPDKEGAWVSYQDHLEALTRQRIEFKRDAKNRDLKFQPCPFCKNKHEEEMAVRKEVLLFDSLHFQVSCSCGACGPYADSIEEALDKWNSHNGF